MTNLPGGPGLLDGEWGPHDGGYALRVGRLFFGFICQRGGDSIYSGCWVVRLNQHFVGETTDPDHARGWVERLICQELECLRPTLKKVFIRAPPAECFAGQDHFSKWKNWKEDKAVEGWIFVAPTLRQIHATLKKDGA